MRNVLALLVLSSTLFFGQDSLNCSLVSTVGKGQQVYGFEIYNNHLFSFSDSTLSIYDITDPYSPILISKVDTLDNDLYSVHVDGSYAYLGGGNGLMILDISDLQNPKLNSHLTFKESERNITVEDVKVQNQIAYLGTLYYMFIVVDVSDVNNPHELTRYDENIDDVWEINIQDTLLFAASEDTGLKIFSINDPANPKELSNLTTEDNPYQQAASVEVEDSLVIFCDSRDLFFFDITNPNEPEFISKVDNVGGWNIFKSGNFVYTLGNKLWVLDINDLPNVTKAGYYPVPIPGFDVRGKDDLIYAASQVDGVLVIEFDEVTPVKENFNTIYSYSLSQNYPNPFNPTTTIQYTIPVVALSEVEVQHVTLRVYDILGREVATLVNEPQIPGKYWVKWNAGNFASGIYFYELRTNDFVKTNKMILIK